MINLEKQAIELQIKKLMRDWSIINRKDVEQYPKIRYSGPLFDEKEYEYMMDAIFNDWHSGGKYTLEAEEKLASISSRNHALLCNSGSSANLLMISAAKKVFGWNDGDGVITMSCGFPTTINPIIQNNLIPHFIDIDIDTLNIDEGKFLKAISQWPNVVAAFIPHTLGFYGDIENILEYGKRYGLKIFFDCCDAYSSKLNNKYIQAYGEAATLSFYVAHHISSMEGGGIVTDNLDLHKTMRSFRSWGRYCDADKCCVRSFNPNSFCPTKKLTEKCDLPDDQPVNYQFEFIGYNLKMLDLQAAILSKQLDRLDEFHIARVNNYNCLLDNLRYHKSIKIWDIADGVCPFAFPILVKSNDDRKRLMQWLRDNNIECRVLFGGNLIKHPAYKDMEYELVYGHLDNSDIIMDRFLMVGVSPVNTIEKTQFMADKIKEFLI